VVNGISECHRCRESGGLHTLGVEAVALSNKSVPQWGASGLLVIAIEPESAAARAGLKEGDGDRINRWPAVGRGEWTFAYAFKRQGKYLMSVVRAREKKADGGWAGGMKVIDSFIH
jgi:hypothetical protein